jgi:hypothetical protein
MSSAMPIAENSVHSFGAWATAARSVVRAPWTSRAASRALPYSREQLGIVGRATDRLGADLHRLVGPAELPQAADQPERRRTVVPVAFIERAVVDRRLAPGPPA